MNDALYQPQRKTPGFMVNPYSDDPKPKWHAHCSYSAVTPVGHTSTEGKRHVMLGSTQNRKKAQKRAEKLAVVAGGVVALGVSLLSFTATEALAANEPWEENYTMSTPYGQQPGETNRAFNPSTRDANGNRVLVNQFSQFSNTAGVSGEGSGVGVSGSALAVGNQLNVVTNGNNNTVIVDSTQINNGNQEAVVLNGTLDLD